MKNNIKSIMFVLLGVVLAIATIAYAVEDKERILLGEIICKKIAGYHGNEVTFLLTATTEGGPGNRFSGLILKSPNQKHRLSLAVYDDGEASIMYRSGDAEKKITLNEEGQ